MVDDHISTWQHLLPFIQGYSINVHMQNEHSVDANGYIVNYPSKYYTIHELGHVYLLLIRYGY